MLQRWPVLKDGEWSLRRWQVIMVMLQRWSVYKGGQLQKWSLMEGEWSCYRGGKFNGTRMVLLQRQPA